MIYILISALAPVIVLLYFVYRKDEVQKEPVKEILKAVGLGVLSVFASFLISGPFGALGLYTDYPVTLWDAVAISFFGAAIPEEIAKFVLFWLFVRKNKWFDEHVDGIVYAAAVSLGFAAFENIGYLLSSEDWVSTGIMRALFSVPGHMFFGILMGYYYSLVRFNPAASKMTKFWVLGAPIIAHGIYDSILFSMDTLPDSLSLALMVIFIFFCNSLRKHASRRIKLHVQQDKAVQEEQ